MIRSDNKPRLWKRKGGSPTHKSGDTPFQSQKEGAMIDWLATVSHRAQVSMDE